MTRPVAYRPARSEDLLTCTQIWSAGIEAYVRRLNQPWFAGDAEPLRRLLAHFLHTDPERFWVATVGLTALRGGGAGRAGGHGPEDNAVIGFGSATLRSGSWFLGMLFVLPEFQAHGVGRRLLEHVMPPPDAPADLALGTATDSVQPISNALYSQYGIVPRLPVFNFVGRPERPHVLPPLPAGVAMTETSWADADALVREAAEIDAVDRATLGYAHPEDHAFLRAEGRRRFLARSERGAVLGYGYMAPSGRFGPLAALDSTLLAPIAADLLATVRAAGAYATWIPGATDDLFVTLLRAGFRFESFPALVLWNRSEVDFSRYVPINLALL